jgi:hypothetical protein
LAMPTFDFLRPFWLGNLWAPALLRAPLAVSVEQNSPTTANPLPTATTATTAVATDALADHGVVGHTTATLLGWVSRECIRLFLPASKWHPRRPHQPCGGGLR